MSELVKFPKRGGRSPQPPSEPPHEPPGGVSIVGHVKRTFLAPDTRRRKLRPVLALAFAGSAKRAKLDHRGRPTAHQIDTAQHWRQVMPSRAELVAAAEMFDLALTVQAKPLEIGAVAAWLIDSYPNRRDDSTSTFADTLELLMEDADEILSAAVIAAAARDLLEQSKFLPTASEFLAATLRMRNTFRGAANAARHVADLRESADDLLWLAGEISDEEYGLSPNDGDPNAPPF